MKKINIIILLIFFTLFMNTALSAAILDWSVVGWSPDGSKNKSYKDVNGSGVNIKVKITGNKGKLIDDTPKIKNNYFYLKADYGNDTQKVVATFTFSVPVKLSSLKWMDIDSDYRNGGDNFDDHIIVAAKDSDGNTVAISSEALGSAIDKNADGDYESDNSQGYTLNDSEAQVTLDYAADYNVTELSFIYTNGDNVRSDPREQAIWFDNITFEALDTDGDGVADFRDIDSDNDGILNAIEIQGGGLCSYGFFHVLSGRLKIVDIVHDRYLNIGTKKKKYNAMAYNPVNGKLYAMMKENDQNDKNGHTMQAGDIMTVDSKTGELEFLIAGLGGSSCADIYNNIYYYRTENKKIKRYNIATNTIMNDLNLDNNASVLDYAIYNGIAYGSQGYDGNDKTKQRLYRIDLSNGNVTTDDYIMPGAKSKTCGAAYIADSNTSVKLYIGNNGGGTYLINNFISGTPSATYTYKTAKSSSNDGASCPDANAEPANSDNDSKPDYLDLDSDNDGIPDNVEAQSTSGYKVPSGTVKANGLWDNYGRGLIPKDTDGDNKADFLDLDSDNDGYTDCEEGNKEVVSNSTHCPVVAVTANGMVDWATDGHTNYADPNGNIDDPDPDGGGNLQDEVTGDHEAAYREFLCGKSLITLSDHKWRLISMPCDTGSHTVEELLVPSLGEYGNDKTFVMYKQSVADNYEVNSSHKNTNKLMLSKDDNLTQGISYWIITDGDYNVTIPKTLANLKPTGTIDANDSSVDIDDKDFSHVHTHSLPDNQMTKGGDSKKYMAGNPFPYAFYMKNLYFSHGSTGGTYHSMDDNSSNESYINMTFYKHDSNETSPTNGYTAVSAGTPGFDKYGLEAMEGFFLKIEDNSSTENNKFAYPLIMKNGN